MHPRTRKRRTSISWSAFSSIIDRLNTKRVKKPNDSYTAQCYNYILVNIALYNAASTFVELLRCVLFVPQSLMFVGLSRSIVYYGKTGADRTAARYREHTIVNGAFAGRGAEIAMIVFDEGFIAGYKSSHHKATVGEWLLEVFQRFYGLNYIGGRVEAGRRCWIDIFLHLEARNAESQCGRCLSKICSCQRCTKGLKYVYYILNVSQLTI